MSSANHKEVIDLANMSCNMGSRFDHVQIDTHLAVQPYGDDYPVPGVMFKVGDTEFFIDARMLRQIADAAEADVPKLLRKNPRG